MSLEDLDSEFKSDESDYEAENNAEDDDDEECSYGELLNLHLNLRRFQNIYTNNAIIDMESMQNDAGPSSNFDSMLSELEFIQDHVDLLEDDYVQDFMQLYEEIVTTASSTSSSSQSSSSSTNTSVSSDAMDE